MDQKTKEECRKAIKMARQELRALQGTLKGTLKAVEEAIDNQYEKIKELINAKRKIEKEN